VARNGGLSPDGQWLTYTINRSNGNNELRVTKIADGTEKVAAFGEQPVYSADSKWIAYSIGQSEAEREKLKSEKKPVQNNLGLLNLATGETSTFEGVESFAFSADGAFLAMRRYPPERPSGESAPGGRDEPEAESEEKPGTTLIVRELANSRDTTLGNVSEHAWQKDEQSHLLAMIISAEDKMGNGVHLFDPATNALRVLDSSSVTYTNLAWRKDASDLAVLRAKTDDHHEGATYVALCWTGLGKAERRYVYDPTADSTFPAGLRTVSFRPLSWSADGNVVLLGLAKWHEKVVPEGGEEKSDESDDATVPDKPSTVEIWHAKDVFVMPWQKIHADEDRRRSMLAAWHIKSGKLVELGKDLIDEQVSPIRHTNLTFVAEWSKYAMERSIGRPAADLYLQDVTTGKRTLLKEGVNDRYVQVGPSGKYMLFLDEGHYWTIDLSTRAITNITGTVPTSFIDEESDRTSKIYPDRLQKPPFGVAGWTKDDADVLLYDKFDLWRIAADGSEAQRLTDGASEEVRHRLVRPDRAEGRRRRRPPGSSPSDDDEGIDLDKPVYLSVFGEWTKKSGYARLDPNGRVNRLVWLDENVGSLAKAKDADVYAYVAQDYDDSPDIFVGGADLKDAKQATATNPFQSDFAWGWSELVDYTTEKGERLQGALYYPAGYKPGRKYPMIVYIYEKLSQNIHRYVAPSDRSYYNLSVFTSHGYFVFQPDIVFTKRQPGVSVVRCVTAGVEKVIQMDIIDPERVGVVGHSMGGFDASYLATHTHGVFAAAVAGAPITDLVSYYGDHHWGTGIAETDHIETGQERMEVALYEDFQAYVDNSPVFNVHNMSVPLLLEVGDVDGIVAWYQSIELYNIARRAKKNVVMLAYIGEDHGLRRKENQRDYQDRILAWFGHYLKGEPAEAWITDGKSFLERDAELKRLKQKK
jgi:dipeptidyl aminopeptidase/acylaminoacyl peptidase